MRELAGKTSEPRTLNLLQHFAKRLTTLDQDFRVFHSFVVDLMEKPDALAVEQDELDKHNDEIATQTAEIQELIAACNATKVPDEPSNQQKILKKRLAVLRKILDWTTSDVDKASSGRPDLTLLQHYDEQFTDVKKELKDIVTHLFLLDMSNDDELEVMPSNLAEL